MAYRRRTSVGIAAALLGAIASVAVAALIAWQMDVRNTQGRLDTMAQLLINRGNQTIEQTSDVLRQLAAAPIAPCTSEHIRLMRQLMVNTPALDEIAYIEHDQAVCSSWGEGYYELEEGVVIGRGDAGVEVSLAYMPALSGGGRAMALAYGPFRALIGLNHFVDVIVEPGMQLGLSTHDGMRVVALGASRDGVLARAMSGGRPTAVPGYQQAYIATPEWVSVVLHPGGGFPHYLREEHYELLPFLLMLGSLVFLLIMSLWRRPPSPLAELRAAIRRKELVVHYQPMLNQHTGQCAGVEALLRWHRSGENWVQPDEFISIAERGRLAEPMTDLLLSIVADELAPLLKASPDLHVSLNLYAEDVRTGRALKVLEDTLIAAGVRPRQIWLEVTERSFMDIESARATLKQARDRGYIVAIDDFGTGYSSLQYLQSLPVDVLKVDKSFIGSIGTGAVSSRVIYHIIEMGKSLNLMVVAEGVETQAQADYLAEQNVPLIQGWLYAKAMPIRDFLRFLRQSRGGENDG